MDMSDAVTVAEAARILGINEATVRRRLARGHMTGQRVGPWLWLIPRAVVEEASKVGRLKPGPPKGRPRKSTRARPAGEE